MEEKSSLLGIVPVVKRIYTKSGKNSKAAAHALEERNQLCRPNLDTLKQWCEQCWATGYHRNTSLERAVVYTLNNSTHRGHLRQLRDGDR